MTRSEVQRQALERRVLAHQLREEGWSMRRIAAHLGKSAPNVQQLIMRRRYELGEPVERYTNCTTSDYKYRWKSEPT